jgi:ABC-type glycerol-3-phosphate transport system substrate-binding protein
MARKSPRIVLLLVACVAAILTLAACGGSDNGSSGDQTSAQTSGGSGGKVELNAIFLPATWGTVVKDTLAPEYEKETGVKVNVQLIARDAIHEKMATLFAAQDSSFDIFNLDYNWIPEFGGAGHLAEMDDVVSAEDRSDFFPLALRVATWDGKLYGVPQTVHPALLWYRRDLYGDPKIQQAYRAATGQELRAPATMDEWKQQAEFFNGRTFNGRKVYGWVAQAQKGFANVHTWLNFLYTYGGRPFNDDFTKSTLDTPEAQAGTAMWAGMSRFMPPGANSVTYDLVTAAAQQGQVATALHWSWGAWAVDDPRSSRTVGDWDYTQVPAAAAGQPSHPHLAEWVISVSRYSQHQEEAKRFAAWLETRRNDVVQASLGGGDPVRMSSYSDPKLLDETIKGTKIKRFRRLDAVRTAMESAQPRPFFPLEERWETTVSTPLQEVALGRESVQDGLKKADGDVDSSLNR